MIGEGVLVNEPRKQQKATLAFTVQILANDWDDAMEFGKDIGEHVYYKYYGVKRVVLLGSVAETTTIHGPNGIETRLKAFTDYPGAEVGGED